MFPTKQLVLGLAAILCFFSAHTQPINADIIVDANGGGDFTTLQAAIDASPSNSDIKTVIYIKRGLYDQEKLIIPADKKNLTFIGESREETIISYDIHNCNDGGDGLCPDEKVALYSGDLVRTAATLTILADDFTAENLTIENTAGNVGQAQAITVRGDRSIFRNCNLTGYQDTVYLWLYNNSYRAYFEGCMILGRTDYIYGNGIGYFNECEIRSFGGGWITAPSTGEDQDYGYVFYNCTLTSVAGSPGAGDDGARIRLGRPWHNYPKVAWLYCDMTEDIHPEGWGDTWNMDYASTDTRLHLYEYQNTGAGADMSGRAAWAGLRAMTDEEAPKYEPEVVLAGNDNWDPTAIAPSVTIYHWTGNGDNDWLSASNWDPDSIPSAGQAANIDGDVAANANGGSFNADLNLTNGATLTFSANSSVTLLSISESTLSASANTQLDGTIRTKAAATFHSDAGIDFEINAKILGIHEISKTGTGAMIVSGNNEGFSGDWIIKAGTLKTNHNTALGYAGAVSIENGGTLHLSSSGGFFPTTRINTSTGAKMILDGIITTSEWYHDGKLLDLGTYTATTHPAIISGSGSIIVGRPSEFQFTPQENGNWDVANNFTPALLPETGETVIVESELEATGSTFTADLVIQNNGAIRLRSNNSVCTGTITMHQNTQIRYATGGTGFTLDAPIVLEGDITLGLNSGNEAGSTMNLPGTFSGSATVKIQNTRSSSPNDGTVLLGGDNSNFTGIWDLSAASANTAVGANLEGNAANAFGKATILAGAINQVIFSHENCAGDDLILNLSESAKAVLNTDVYVKTATINGTALETNKIYDASTHPEFFEGSGALYVDYSEPIVTYSISVNIVGQGTVATESSYDAGESVTLTAVAAENWLFETWSGDITSQDSIVTFTINSDMNLTATFEEKQISPVLATSPNNQMPYLSDGKIFFPYEEYKASIYTLGGQELVRIEDKASFSLKSLSKGAYLIRWNHNEQVGSAKFINQ